MAKTTQEIFDSLSLDPRDGMHKGDVFGTSMINAEMFNEIPEQALVIAERMADEAMTKAADDNDLRIVEGSKRRYCAVTYAWVPGAATDDDDNDRTALMPIAHSVHGRPMFDSGAPEDSPVYMIQVFWVAQTEAA